MPTHAKDIFQEMGITGGAAAVTRAAEKFLHSHQISALSPAIRDLSVMDLEILKEGGFPIITSKTALSENLTIIAAEIGVMIAGALSQDQAAQLMSVDRSRIRQRISKGTLYAIPGNKNVKVLPRFQFTDNGVLPGLEKVLPVINYEAHPVTVQRFFVTISQDLNSTELRANLSPRDWLLSGHIPDPVIVMAKDL